MTLSRSFIRNAATTPLDARLLLMAGITANANGSPRAGVIGGSNPSIVTTTATMNVAVAAAEFATTKGRADGVAIFVNDGTVNVAIGAAPGSNSRIDVIWVKHNDDTTGDADALPVFGVTAGTAAASPTKPAIPTGALELATLRVYAGTTATNGGSNVLTNTYAMTVARGGIVPFRTKVELDAWTTPADGQVASVTDDDTSSPLYVWNGTAWRRHSGVLAKASSSPASQIVAGSEVALTGMSVTFTLARAGDVRIIGGLNTIGGSVDNVVVIRIKEGAAVLFDIARMANGSPSAPSISNYQNFAATLPFAAGTHTVSVVALRAAGAGSITVAPAAASPSQLSAEMFD